MIVMSIYCHIKVFHSGSGTLQILHTCVDGECLVLLKNHDRDEEVEQRMCHPHVTESLNAVNSRNQLEKGNILEIIHQLGAHQRNVYILANRKNKTTDSSKNNTKYVSKQCFAMKLGVLGFRCSFDTYHQRLKEAITALQES